MYYRTGNKHLPTREEEGCFTSVFLQQPAFPPDKVKKLVGLAARVICRTFVGLFVLKTRDQLDSCKKQCCSNREKTANVKLTVAQW